MKYKYQIRRLIAISILLVLLTFFTSVVINKGIDAEIKRQDAVMEQHFKDWGIEKLK